MSSRMPRSSSWRPDSSDRTAGRSKGALRSITGESHGVVFEDPRAKSDRRLRFDEESIPASGCRRQRDRRSDRLNLGVWWMKRNYCVDLTRPKRKKPANSDSLFRRED